MNHYEIIQKNNPRGPDWNFDCHGDAPDFNPDEEDVVTI
jgi:hypothetical protein